MTLDKYITFNEFYREMHESKDPVKVIKEHPELFGRIGILKTIYYLERHLEDLN